MPSTSKKQQAFMAIAEHDPSKLRGKKPDMSQQQLHDFAATPTKGLPEKAPKHHDARPCDHSPVHSYDACPNSR